MFFSFLGNSEKEKKKNTFSIFYSKEQKNCSKAKEQHHYSMINIFRFIVSPNSN